MSNNTPELRWCVDIGMFAVDRPIPTTKWAPGCTHKTPYCTRTCYNNKLYKLYPAMHAKDVRNEQAWQDCDGVDYADSLDLKHKPTHRFRLMTRGEAFATLDDVERVADIARANPYRLLWVPTRAWRDPMFRARIEGELFNFNSMVILASLDPSNTEAEWRDLVSAGWSTMYYGKPNAGWDGPTRKVQNAKSFYCPKTYGAVDSVNKERHKPIKGHCIDCVGGCFAPATLSRRVDVLMKQH